MYTYFKLAIILNIKKFSFPLCFYYIKINTPCQYEQTKNKREVYTSLFQLKTNIKLIFLYPFVLVLTKTL